MHYDLKNGFHIIKILKSGKIFSCFTFAINSAYFDMWLSCRSRATTPYIPRFPNSQLYMYLSLEKTLLNSKDHSPSHAPPKASIFGIKIERKAQMAALIILKTLHFRKALVKKKLFKSNSQIHRFSAQFSNSSKLQSSFINHFFKFL